MIKKHAQVANFNVVFGEKEIPMLDYFDTIIYPAFTSGISKKSNDTEYLLIDVEILQNEKMEYIFVGKIVKKTMLEVLTDMNEERELIKKDERYSTAPYSTFAICLKNHRMLFVPNQKGSPTLVNFRSTITYIIRQHISLKNKELDDGSKLPFPMINVVGIPSSRGLKEILQNVLKVNKLILKFYPLNGDVDFEGTFSGMTTGLRRMVSSKTGRMILNSPKSVDGIIDVLAQAGGTVNPILEVTTRENSKLTLKDYEISEKYELEFSDDTNFENETELIVSKINNIETLSFTNDEHDKIYNRNIRKIIPFRKK